MSETYCGKSCTQCPYKEAMNCPGCRVGPGRQYGGDCELAKCVRSKGHQICATCELRGNCGYYRDSHHFPEYRRRRKDAQLQQQEALARRAPVLGKWLWLLFWLVIPATIASLISSDFIGQLYPGLYDLGKIMGIICPAGYGFILLRLSQEENEYRTAGIFTLISAGLNLILTITPVTLDNLVWLFLLSIPAVVVEGIAEYCEYSAHSTVLADFDRELSGKWLVLRKWFLGMYLGVVGGLILMMARSANLGAMIMLVSSIGVLVVSILKLIYLYRTAKVFR